MNPRDEIKKIHERLDEIEAGLPPKKLDKAIQAVLDAESFFNLESQGCSEIIFATDVAHYTGRVTVSNQGKKPHFEGNLFIQPRALSAIERLDEVFKGTHDC